MEKDNTTTRSFRISDTVNEKFKEISEEIGGNQSQVLSKLLETYEFQKGKIVLADKKSDIETFENYINSITRMYMGALKDNQNANALIRTEFEAQLDSKDTIIQDLQHQLELAKKTEQEATSTAEGFKGENERLNEYIKSLQEEFESKNNGLQEMLEEKEKLNKILTETAERQKLQITGIEKKADEAEALKAELEECQKELSSAKKENERLQIKHEKDMISIEKKFQNEKIEEINKYQKMYFELLQKQEPPKKTTTRTRKTTAAKTAKEGNEE